MFPSLMFPRTFFDELMFPEFEAGGVVPESNDSGAAGWQSAVIMSS